MVEPPEISRTQLENDPRLLWRTFVEFMRKADTTLMNDVQMAAQLPLWYDTDVQEGGHLKYFENHYHKLGDKLNVLIMATLDALKIIGAHNQAETLARAADVYFAREREHSQDPDEYARMELEGEFENFDNEYFDCAPNMDDLLTQYLNCHTDDFVRII